MSDTTMIEVTEKKIPLNEAELEILRNNIEKAFRVAPERVVKPGQHLILASRMLDGRMLVVLNPHVGQSSKEHRPVILEPEDKGLFQQALSTVYGRAKNLTVVNGVPLRSDIKGKNFDDFFREDYYLRVRKGIEYMTIEWDLEDQNRETYRTALQLEVKKVDNIFVENWSIVSKPK